MSSNYVTELLPPTVSTSRSGGNVVLEIAGSWRTTYDGGEAYKHMDCCWDARYTSRPFDQIASHSGEGEMESDKLLLNRLNYYPRSGEYLNGVRYRVRGVFEGKAKWTDFWHSPAVRIAEPPAPKVTIEPASDGSKHEVKVKVEPGAYDDPRTVYEHYDFEVQVRWMGTRTRTVDQTRYSEPLASSFEEGFDISTAEAGLAEGEYVLFEVSAWARGLGGRSARSHETYVFAQPPVPIIEGVSTQGDRSTGIVCVRIDTRNSMFAPVDSVTLERAKSTAQSVAELLYMDDVTWTQVKATDGGDCTGLTDNLADAYPTFGERTYYRVKSTHGIYSRYSHPVDMGIYHPLPTYEPGCAYIFNSELGDDGKSAAIDVAWQPDATIGAITEAQRKAYKGVTRLSWSDFEHAWFSTGGLSKFDFSWAENTDNPIVNPPSPGYTNKGRIWVTGLEEGKRVFVRAQRVLKGSGGDEIEGELSNKVAITPASTPSSVTAQAPKYVARGSSIMVSWSYQSDAQQLAWALVDIDTGDIVGAGSGSETSCPIPAARLASRAMIRVCVMMTTGGNWVRSDAVSTRIVDAPNVEALVLSRISSMPFCIIAGSSESAVVDVTITSRGIVYERPEGTVEQHAGDIVWAGTGSGAIVVSDANLVNGCTYDVVAKATDAETGLSTETVAASFTVGWNHLASLPVASVIVDKHALSATVSVAASEGSSPEDMFDVYRSTPDGHTLIASGIASGCSVTDRFAPFAFDGSGVSTSYRVCCRTKDGDMLWVDVPYRLDGMDLVCDFGNSRVSLPYNIDSQDDFAKRFERHSHLNGNTHGTWARGSDRDMSISTDVVKVEQAERQRLVRKLARHDGPVFVRLPNGAAFEANVNVHIAQARNSAAVAVSLDCAEVDLTDVFKPGARDIGGV